MSGLLRGIHRILVAPMDHSHPGSVGDIVSLENGGQYDPVGKWRDVGACKSGIAHNGLKGLLGDESGEDGPGYFIAVQIAHDPPDIRDKFALLGRAIGKPIRIAFLRQNEDGEVEGDYFPAAVTKPFSVDLSRGECGATFVRWDVGPIGYRRLS